MNYVLQKSFSEEMYNDIFDWRNLFSEVLHYKENVVPIIDINYLNMNIII